MENWELFGLKGFKGFCEKYGFEVNPFCHRMLINMIKIITREGFYGRSWKDYLIYTNVQEKPYRLSEELFDKLKIKETAPNSGVNVNINLPEKRKIRLPKKRKITLPTFKQKNYSLSLFNISNLSLIRYDLPMILII